MNLLPYICLVNEEIKERLNRLLEKFENKELLEVNITLKKFTKIKYNKLYEKKIYNLLNKPKYYIDFIKFVLQHNNLTLIDLNKGNMHKFKKEPIEQFNFNKQTNEINFFGDISNNFNSSNTDNSVVNNALKSNTMNHYFYINKLI